MATCHIGIDLGVERLDIAVARAAVASNSSRAPAGDSGASRRNCARPPLAWAARLPTS